MTRGRPVLLALVWLVAFNLSAGFIAVGPMMALITADLGLSHTQASFLVALPTAMMGLAAVPGGRLTDRWGVSRVIVLGLALVALAGLAAKRGIAILIVYLKGVDQQYAKVAGLPLENSQWKIRPGNGRTSGSCSRWRNQMRSACNLRRTCCLLPFICPGAA